MIQVKKTSIMTFIISTVFLIASTSAFAEYTQTQNKVDDKLPDSGKQSQSNYTQTQKKIDDKMPDSGKDTQTQNKIDDKLPDSGK